MSLKERYCHIRAKGCKIKFLPKRFWHRVCDNSECKRENARRLMRKWRKDNPEYHKDYNKDYQSMPV